MLKGNKGEWSEFYAFLKVLADGRLFAADKDLKKIFDKYFHVLQVVREEAGSGKQIYDLLNHPGKILVINAEDNILSTLDQEELGSKLGGIFEKIIKSKGTTFEIPMAKDLMKKLHCTQIKAGSDRKSDIFLKVYDSITPETPDLGFSIKSMLGSPSTLLNASGGTNFVFKVRGWSGAIEEINAIETQTKMRDRMKLLTDRGCELVYEGMDSESFERNLRKIDTVFPKMLAEALIVYYMGDGAALTDVSQRLGETSVLAKKFGISQNDFEYKLKLFLVAIALGMKPEVQWDGRTLVHGGYIIVKDDGEVLCYHLYNRDQFEDYLFLNTKFETPSTSRHKFGNLYQEGDRFYLKLNVQIRFKK